MASVLVSCGEASGDLLASGVVRALKAADPSLRVFGLGGARCREAGAETQHDISALSVMGFTEVLPKLRSILKLMDDMVELAAREKPEAALLVDAPDFNLRLAKKLKRRGVRVVYYVSPTVWLWRAGRVKHIRRWVDELCCIFPFEQEWYAQRGMQVRFVGHPLLEHEPAAQSLEAVRRQVRDGAEGPVLALLPGSRRFEVRNLLPDMLGAARVLAAQHPGLRVVLPVAPSIGRRMIEDIGHAAGFVPHLVEGRAREVLEAADAALVAVGTATLEAALARTPLVVVYRVSLLSELIYRLLFKMKTYGLPSILAGRRITPELFQRDITPAACAQLLSPLLTQTPQRARQVAELAAVRASLGAPGASHRVAEAVLSRALPAPAAPRIADA